MMTGIGSNPLGRGASSDLWRNTLSQIPSIFARLVYLNSLRNPNTSRYEHHGLALVFGEDEANKALRKSHTQTFADWLSLDLERQKADLDLYISSLFEEKRVVLESWMRLMPYRNLVPNSVRPLERRLYLADLKALLELLTNEHAAGGPDRGALPPL